MSRGFSLPLTLRDSPLEQGRNAPTISSVFSRQEQLRKWAESPTNKESNKFKFPKRVSFDKGTCFLSACSNGDIEDAQKWIERGASVDSTNFDGLTALHQATLDGDEEVIEFLLNNGANVGSQDAEGWTPLHAASFCELSDIVELLLSRGADPYIVNNDGDLPIDLVEDETTSSLLRKAMQKLSKDIEAVRNNEHRLLLEDVSRWRQTGYDHLNARIDPKIKATPLHVAAAKGYSDVVQKLLECRGIDLEAKDVDGWTALHAAAHWGQRESIRLLCEAGSNIDATTFAGLTPIEVADEGIVSYLRQFKEKFGVKLRRNQARGFRDSVETPRITNANRRSSVIRHSMDQKSLTRMQKEVSPLAMVMENLLLKKTLSGIVPREKRDSSLIIEENKSKVLQYHQKMLSFIESSKTTDNENILSPTKEEIHETSECCLHGKIVKNDSALKTDKDSVLKIISDPVLETKEFHSVSHFPVVKINSSGNTENEETKLFDDATGTSDVSPMDNDHLLSNDVCVTEPESKDEIVHKLKDDHPISKVGASNENSSTDDHTKMRSTNDITDLNMHSTQTTIEDASDPLYRNSKEETAVVLRAKTVKSPLAAVIENEVKETELSEDDTHERPEIGSLKEDQAARVSAIMSPMKSLESETERTSKSRQVLAERRPTQAEVAEDSADTTSTAVDTARDYFPFPPNYEFLYLQLKKEHETLLEKVSILSDEREVQKKTIHRLSEGEEYHKRTQELENENALLKLQRTIDEMKMENTKLKEENASLIRVISKLSAKSEGNKDYERPSSYLRSLSRPESSSELSQNPVYTITRL